MRFYLLAIVLASCGMWFLAEAASQQSEGLRKLRGSRAVRKVTTPFVNRDTKWIAELTSGFA